MGRQVYVVLGILVLLLSSCSIQEQPTAAFNEDTFTNFVADDIGATLPTEMEMVDAALSDANTADDAFYRMVKEVGGFTAYEQKLMELDDTALDQFHKQYGLGFTRGMPGSSLNAFGDIALQAITDCVEFFPASDRNRVFRISGHTVFIDNVGRPGYAKLNFRRNQVIAPNPVRTKCQTDVREWGDPGDVGGHLIPAVLGGYNKRANIVPQNGTMNNSVWRKVENLVRKCVTSRYSGSYTVTPQYADPTSVRPSHLQAYVVLYRPLIPIVPAVTGTLRLPNQVPGAAQTLAAEGFIANFTPYCTRIVGLIIDDTGSMGSQIGAVKASLANYITDVPEEQDTLWNLTTFKDAVSNKGTTAELSTISGWVGGLRASGGDDCPEEALGAIRSGIRTLSTYPDRGRDLIVVTDASAQPGDISGIIAAANLDDVRVSVLLSGDCGRSTTTSTLSSSGLTTLSHSYPLSSQVVLKEIADATGGKYFFIPGGTRQDYENALDEIFAFIEEGSTDTTPPTITLSTDSNVLWPPNHKMREVSVEVVVEDDTDLEPMVELVGVVSTEPFDGQGDGHTEDDIQVDEEGRIFVRAERSGSGNDRIYTVTYRATDAAGNVGFGSLDFLVPHDKRKK